MTTGTGFKFHRALHRALLVERKNGMDNIETLRDTKTAWLIELAADIQTPFHRWYHPEHGFVWDASKAIHFCRKEDGEAYLKSSTFLRGAVTEHVFIAVPPAALEASAAPKPWPQVGDKYWKSNGYGQITHHTWAGDFVDKGALTIGNVFRTEQEAIDERDRRKVVAIMREMADGGDCELQLFSAPNKEPFITVVDMGCSRSFNVCRFPTRELAQACLDRIVKTLDENNSRDGMARLLELWVAK